MNYESLATDSLHVDSGVGRSSNESSLLEQVAPARLLLVDDDEDELLIVRSLLRESAHTMGALRFTLDWVSDVEAALREIERAQHDVYLIDYRLGDATGLQLIERAVAAGCEAPLILLSGLDDPRVDAEAIRAGATDYLVKDGLNGALLERTLRYAIAGKRSERELRAVAAQNARLLAAIESANVGVVLTELSAAAEESRVTYVNPAFSELTGYGSDAVVGQNLGVLSALHTAPEFVTQVRGALRAGRAYEGTTRSVRSDGTPFWNEVHFAPIGQAGGPHIGNVGFFQDVSARIEAEKAVSAARQDLENAQELTHLGSWSHEVAPDGTVSGFWSDESYRILGLEPQDPDIEARCESWIERVHPDDRAQAQRVADEAQCSPTPCYFEGRVVRPDGEARTIQVRALRERAGSATESLRVVGTVLDITQRARAEAHRREIETRLSSVAEAVPIIVWAIDNAGRFTLSQGSALRDLGLESGEAVGQSIGEVYGDYPKVLRLIERALGGETIDEIVVVSGRSFAVYAVPQLDVTGAQTGVSGISYDITEQARAQQALRESEARFERIMLNVPGMVYQLVQNEVGEHHFDYVSEACQDFYGVTPAQALEDADLLLGAVAEEDKAEFKRSVAQSAREGSDWMMELTIVRTDGTRRFIRGQSRPIKRADGAVVWDGILVDLTQSKRADEALERSAHALDEAQKLAGVGSFSWNLRTGEALWSDEMYRMFELEPGSPVPGPMEAIAHYHPDDRATLADLMKTRAAGGGAEEVTVRLVRSDGSIRHLETRASLQFDEAGKPLIMNGSLQDVTQRVEAQRALSESEERYALVARATNDGLWDWNLLTDKIYYSPHWKAMLGFAETEIGDAPDEWFNRIHPEDVESVQTHKAAHLSGASAQCECEYRLLHAGGEYRWMLGRGLAIFDEEGVATRLSGSQTDITERKLAETQLEYNAFYDTALTHLPNRALFAERLDRTIARGNRQPEHTFAVLFLDIDRFKKINDSLGHLTGDRLLIEASRRFQNCLRPGDTVARFGGDEFAILLDDVSSIDDVHHVADRIHAELEAPFQLDGHEAFVTVSIGIVMGQGDKASAEELLRSADTAMYRAKGSGRGQHQMFEATMHARAVKMLEMETDLWRALERDELRLHYQPIINLNGGQIEGFEALVRWQHPSRGLVSPADFIPLAEESGLIVPIGWWVLEEACRQAQGWQAEFGPLWMSVNLSPKQLSQPDILERVKSAIERTGFDPHLLKLEITESVLMENSDLSAQMLREIQDLGARFSMDDFGTGYSSLSYLHRFPLDTIKVDRSFVSQMKPDARDHEIVGTIISMARGLRMNVVAEGVETAEQLQSLREMRCGFAQGFYMSKPQESALIEALLRRDLRW